MYQGHGRHADGLYIVPQYMTHCHLTYEDIFCEEENVSSLPA